MVSRRAAALAALLLMTSCVGSDTAILLEVRGTERVDKLVFVIGARVAIPGKEAIFLQDPTSSIEAVVTGRDLATAPFRLLVHDGVADGTPILGAVLGYASGVPEPVATAVLGPVEFVPGETLLYRLELASGAVTVSPTGCVSWQEGSDLHTIAPTDDQDCDGVRPPDDCDDHDANVRPGIDEVCGNGIDDNCNDQIDESPDADGDGWHLCDGDCDDHDRAVHPGATEICDGKDNDCNGKCDDGFDADGDTFTICGTQILSGGKCKAAKAPDCNDKDPTVNPAAPEVCDGKDNDCNGICDDGLDGDGDGFTTCGTFVGLCGAPAAALEDCRDTSAAVRPFAHELCDGFLDACGGSPETAEPCYRNPQQQCTVGVRACDDTRGGGLSASCEATSDPMLTIPIAAELCTAYAGPCASDPEPWRCANATAGAIFDCTIAWRRVAGSATQPPTATLCAPATTTAPTLGLTNACQLVLVGGVAQEGYDVGFLPRNGSGTPAPFLDDCTGDLVVSAATNPYLPQPDQWVVLVADATHTRRNAALLRVTPKLVTTCPPSGLSCTMRVP